MSVPDSHVSYVQAYLEVRCLEMKLIQKVRESVILTEIGKCRDIEDGPISAICECLFSHILIAAKSLQSCPTLCDPIDGSPPGSPVPGILQARTLEWVAISFSNARK